MYITSYVSTVTVKEKIKHHFVNFCCLMLV